MIPAVDRASSYQRVGTSVSRLIDAISGGRVAWSQNCGHDVWAVRQGEEQVSPRIEFGQTQRRSWREGAEIPWSEFSSEQGT